MSFPEMPESSEFHRHRGEYFLSEGLFDRAIDAFTAGLKISPTDIELLMARSEAYRMLGNETASIEDIDAAAILEPYNPEPLIIKAQHYSDKSEWEKALTLLNKAEEKDRSWSHTFHVRGIVYMQMERIKSALLDFQRAYEIEPDNSAIGLSLVEALVHPNNTKSDPQQAIVILRQIIEKHPNNGDAHLEYANILATEPERAEQALHEYNRAEKLLPDKTEIHLARAALLLDLDRIDKAAQDYRWVLHLDPDNSEANAGMGEIYWRWEKIEEADSYFNRALQTQPRHPMALVGYAEVVAARAEYDKAIKLCQEAEPHPEALLLLGRIQLAIGNAAEAVDCLTHAISAGADPIEGHINRAAAYTALSQPEAAERDLAWAVQNSDWELNVVTQWVACMVRENPRRALKKFVKRCSQRMKSKRFRSLRLIYCHLLAINGEIEQAITTVTRYMQKYSEDMEAHLVYGEILLEANQPAEALAKFKQIEAMSQGNPLLASLKAQALDLLKREKDCQRERQAARILRISNRER